ncbi:hypothetical protein C0993_008827 [Termitomyces sp. T159_Od127]|nr:hypothetical protein C0993_008827 [Termitomyces sp. T159_Od127]
MRPSGLKFSLCFFVEDISCDLVIDPGGTIDATRLDGTKVIIKVVDSSTDEYPIARYLNSPELRSDKRNRSVTILDVMPYPGDDTKLLMVMPHLVHFNRVPFRRVGEIHEAIYQYVQGLEFMHEHDVSHRYFDHRNSVFPTAHVVRRDPCWFNLMMDASKVIPRGTHFARPHTHYGFPNDTFKWRQRWSVKPVQYYYIDFDISRRYPPEAKDVDLKEMTRAGQDKSVPEFKRPGPYNPFKADIYQLGNVILRLVNEYNPEGLEPFLNLGKAMSNTNPSDRPSVPEILAYLDQMDDRTFKRRIWRPQDSDLDKFKITHCWCNPRFGSIPDNDDITSRM